MTKFAQTAQEAREAGLAMVLAGAPQSGKGHLLEIEQRSMFKTDQETLFIRLQRESDALRQFQVLLHTMAVNTMPKEWRLYRLSCLASLFTRRLQLHNKGLVILTNCQVADRDFFNVLFDVMAELRAREHPCGLILAGSGEISDLEDLTADRAASVRQYVSIPPLGHGDIAACLKAWCGQEGVDLARRVGESETDALKVLGLIADSTLGNISRVRQFASLKNLTFPAKAFTPRLVNEVYAEMRGGRVEAAKK
jgi:hypothetical protein